MVLETTRNVKIFLVFMVMNKTSLVLFEEE